MELKWRDRAAAFMIISPVTAQTWLQFRNKFNRDQRPSVISQYARDMQDGRWSVTGETVSFDWNGQLINGQHRLEAIVESGKSLELLVVTGLDPLTRVVVDTQAKRSAVDAFDGAGVGDLLGGGHRNTVAGMWALMMIGIAAGKGRATRTEIVAFAERYYDGGLFAMNAFRRHPRVRGVFVAPALAAVARAFYHYPADVELARLERFVEVLLTGRLQRREDDTVHVLREWLINGRRGRNSNAGPDIYGKTCRAIQAFMQGQVLGKLYAPSDEPFPLPERSAPSTNSRADRMAFGAGQLGDRGSSTPGLVGAAG